MLDWNDRLLEQVAERLVPALDEIDLRIEARAEAELFMPTDFPKSRHGKVEATLQRSIHTQAARRQALSVVGAVGTEPLPYALKIHKRYRFLLIGLAEAQPKAVGIIERHLRRRG